MPSFKFSLGVFVVDQVTGFRGVITARQDHLTGCNRYAVQPLAKKNGGRLPASFWFDEHALKVDNKHQRLTLERDEDDPPG
jgi:hypothetical protein